MYKKIIFIILSSITLNTQCTRFPQYSIEQTQKRIQEWFDQHPRDELSQWSMKTLTDYDQIISLSFDYNDIPKIYISVEELFNIIAIKTLTKDMKNQVISFINQQLYYNPSLLNKSLQHPELGKITAVLWAISLQQFYLVRFFLNSLKIDLNDFQQNNSPSVASLKQIVDTVTSLNTLRPPNPLRLRPYTTPEPIVKYCTHEAFVQYANKIKYTVVSCLRFSKIRKLPIDIIALILNHLDLTIYESDLLPQIKDIRKNLQNVTQKKLQNTSQEILTIQSSQNPLVIPSNISNNIPKTPPSRNNTEEPKPSSGCCTIQ